MFQIRQILKMFLQNMLLPLFYAWYARKPVRKGVVIFADAHHEEMPFSMRRVYETLTCGGRYQVLSCVRDFDRMSYGELMRYLIWFMKQYATAEYVFLCDYYLPASACRKRAETTLIQLWHSCGLMKKIAYDTDQDIPKGYRGNMFGNYTYLTLSARACVPVHARALRIPAERIYATGVSRTDFYFDEAWNDSCRRAFYERYPQAEGRRIALWAPTFRGNAAMPRLEGLQEIQRAEAALQDEWFFIIKAHPHVDAHGKISNCTIPTEELLPAADLLITDYSSVLFDYLLYRKPAILFAPDLEEYEAGRGFYLNYRDIPFPITRTAKELERAVRESARGDGREEDGTARFREMYVGACDGHATERILELAGLAG